MKLKSFTREDCPQLAMGTSTLRVTEKGTFTFNKFAVKGIGLKPNVKIEILQDEDRPVDWYIKKSTHPNAFTLRGKSGESLVCNAQPIAKLLLKSLGKPGLSTSFRMATEPVEEMYYAIITKSVKA